MPIKHLGRQITYNASQQNPDIAIPVANLALAMEAATIYDLGSTLSVSNNILTSRPTMNSFLIPVNTNATMPELLGSTLPGAAGLMSEPNFPISANGLAYVRAEYLCHVKRIKSAPALIVAVLGLAGSLLVSSPLYIRDGLLNSIGQTSILTIFTVVAVKLIRRNRDDMMYCVGHSESTISVEMFSKGEDTPSSGHHRIPTLSAVEESRDHQRNQRNQVHQELRHARSNGIQHVLLYSEVPYGSEAS